MAPTKPMTVELVERVKVKAGAGAVAWVPKSHLAVRVRAEARAERRRGVEESSLQSE